MLGNYFNTLSDLNSNRNFNPCPRTVLGLCGGAPMGQDCGTGPFFNVMNFLIFTPVVGTPFGGGSGGLPLNPALPCNIKLHGAEDSCRSLA